MPKVTVHSGKHPRSNCPLVLPLGLPDSHAAYVLRSESGNPLPLQRLSEGQAVFIEPALIAGESRTYSVHQQPASSDRFPTIHVRDEGVEGIALLAGNHLITRYHYLDAPARPYFFPLLTPDGIGVTRAYPMADVAGETRDHPHHRSLWIAYGEANQVDNWSEETGHGHTRHQTIDTLTSGPVLGEFASTSLWTSRDQTPVLTQKLRVRAWNAMSPLRILDFAIDLIASHGEVHFGDTKEGGILSIRVASAMDVPRGGKIENNYGGIDEGETWGKAAHWCDYSGTVDQTEVGIAVLDHPISFRYPTHWHVRNYGLMTANPFGYSAFTNGRKEGSYVLPSGGMLSFRYRVILHPGDAQAADIRARYLDFAAPPRVDIHLDDEENTHL